MQRRRGQWAHTCPNPLGAPSFLWDCGTPKQTRALLCKSNTSLLRHHSICLLNCPGMPVVQSLQVNQTQKMLVFLSKLGKNFYKWMKTLPTKRQVKGCCFFFQKTYISTWREKIFNYTNKNLKTQFLILGCWRPQKFDLWCLLIWFHDHLTSITTTN